MTGHDLVEILKRIHYQNRQEEPWQFKCREVYDYHASRGSGITGWLIHGRFIRPETHTGVTDWGRTREEFVSIEASEDAVIKTCWVLIMLTEQHEAMEAFKVDGLRVFDPHMELHRLQKAESEQLASFKSNAG